MALRWLCGGYVFHVMVKPEILTFEVKFDLEVPPPPTPHHHHKKNRDLNQGILHLLSKFSDPSFNRWWVMVQTSWKLDKFEL